MAPATPLKKIKKISFETNGTWNHNEHWRMLHALQTTPTNVIYLSICGQLDIGVLTQPKFQYSTWVCLDPRQTIILLIQLLTPIIRDKPWGA